MTKASRPKLNMLKPSVALLDTNAARTLDGAPAKWGSLGRLSAEERGYGWSWKKLRLQILKRDGWRCRCDKCKRTGRLLMAHEVHHVIGKAQWQMDRGTLDGVDDPSNLVAVNRDCHAAITGREAARHR